LSDLPFPVEILNLVRDVLKDKRNSIGTFSTGIYGGTDPRSYEDPFWRIR